MAFTVTATQSGSSSNRGVYLKVLVLTGATETGGATSGANSATGTVASGSLTPNFSGSFVGFSVSEDGVPGGLNAAASNNTYDYSNGDATDSWSSAQGHYTGTVTASSALTYGEGTFASGDHSNWCAYEVPQSGGSWSIDPSTPAGVNTTTATSIATASFTPPAGSVLVALVTAGGNGSGTGVTVTMTDTSGLGLTWTRRAISSTSDNFQPCYVFTTTVPVVTIRSAAFSASPGRTWQRRFHHIQRPPFPSYVPPPPLVYGNQPHGFGSSRRSIGAVFGGIANSPLPSPAGQAPGGVVVPRSVRQRARLLTAHIAGAAAAVAGVAGAKPGGFLGRRRPARAVFAGLAAAPILAHAVTGGLVAQRPPAQRPRAVTAHVVGIAHVNGQRPGGQGVYRRSPARAVTGHVAGIAFPNGQRPGGTGVYRRAPARAVTGHVVAAAFPNGQRPGGSVTRRAPARAVTAHVAGRAFPNGQRPGGQGVYRRAAARAVTGHVAGIAFPNGSRTGGTGVYRRAAARAVTAHVAGRAVALGPAGSRPGGTVARRMAARAVTGHVYGQAAGAVAGPAGSPPSGLVVRRQSAGGLWGGLASSRVPPPGPAGSQPGGIAVRRSPVQRPRAAIGHVTGQVRTTPVPAVRSTAQPQVASRRPVRALWGGIAVQAPAPAAVQARGLVAGRDPRQRPRAVQAHAAGPAFTGNGPVGSQPGGIAVRRSPVQRPRAVTAYRAASARLNGSRPGGLAAQRAPQQHARAVTSHVYGAAVSPAGSLQPRPFVGRRAPARAVVAGTVVRTTNAGPTPPVRGSLQPVAAQPAQRPASRRSRSVAAHIASAARPNGAQPGGLVRRRAAYRAVWAAVTGTVAGKPAVGGVAAQRSPLQRSRGVSTGHAYGTVRRPVPATGGLAAQRAPQQRPRLVTAHVYGAPVFPPGSIQPHPSVNRRRPARGQWLGTVVRTVDAPPAVASPGTVTASDRPAQTVAAADWPAQTVTAADRAAFTVAAADMSP